MTCAATVLLLCDMSLEAIRYDGKRLQILNQLLLPAQTVYEDIESVEGAWEAIRSMKVRNFIRRLKCGACNIICNCTTFPVI